MYAEVLSVEHLTPSMIRVELTGGELDQFELVPATDAYINARFLPAGSPVKVPFDTADLDEVEPALRPRPRRFTVRRWDPEQQKLTIDFVAHGDVGFAGAWAARTQPGDRLQFEGPGGSYRPGDDLDWHLFVGDESALPAIAASLEALPAGRVARVFAVVDGPAHELPLQSDADVSITWLHRMGADDPETLLLDAVSAADFGDGTFDVFVHGEANETRAIRMHLVVDRGIDLETASISPYWRRTFDDEAWRAVKRDWMAQQAAELAAQSTETEA